MQLYVRLGAARDQARNSVERHLGRSVQRVLMHLVKRAVHEAREQSLDPEVAAHQASHQGANRRVLAERNQRTEIAIVPGLQWFAGQSSLHLLDEVRGLLVRRLRARRDITARMIRPRAGGTVSDDEYVFVARRPQRLRYDELVAAGALEAIKIGEYVGRLDASRPNHELGRNEAAVRQLYSCRGHLSNLR